MKKAMILCAVGALMAAGIVSTVAASGSASAVVERGATSKEALQRMYVEFLKGEGYKPEIDDDGDVRFKREGKMYFLQVNDKDEGYYRLCFINFWKIESPTERAKVLAAVDTVNRTIKLARAFTVKDNVWISVDLMFARPEEFKPVFARSISAAEAATAKFVQLMKD